MSKTKSQLIQSQLILNGLVWTYAKFEQIRGRLVRLDNKRESEEYSERPEWSWLKK